MNLGTLKLTIFGFATLLLLNACDRVEPIFEVRDQPIFNSTKSLSIQQIENRITLGARTARWVVVLEKAGRFRARKQWGNHTVIASIPYTETNYSILFQSADNILGNPSARNGRSIHRRYNHFVRQLSVAINEELSREGTIVSETPGSFNRSGGREVAKRSSSRRRSEPLSSSGTPAKRHNTRLAALRAAAPKGKTSLNKAFARLPDGPLSPAEIRLLVTDQQAQNSKSAGGNYVEFSAAGILEGQTSINHSDYYDSGRWSISKSGRLCMKWREKFNFNDGCYQVIKERNKIGFYTFRGKLDYEMSLRERAF